MVTVGNDMIQPSADAVTSKESPPDVSRPQIGDPSPNGRQASLAVDSFTVPLGELPTDDLESRLADTKIDVPPNWPSIAWERRLLARTPHLSMPRVLDSFRENGFEYLIEEVPVGRSFWDAWEET